MNSALDPDDLAAFRQAVADVAPLPAPNRRQLAAPPSRRILPPRPQATPNTARPQGKPHQADLPASWQQVVTTVARIPSDPEAAALFRAMQGVTPLDNRNRVELDRPRPKPRPRQFIADEQAALHESLHGPISLQDRLEGGDEPYYLRFGLANSVLKDLRRGRWVMQAELDLHGLNRDHARRQMAEFLVDCLHQGHRCVRIIHGKGHGSPQKLSILRQLVRGWLAQRIEVLAYCQAKPQDGGEGALIALLQAKKQNGTA